MPTDSGAKAVQGRARCLDLSRLVSRVGRGAWTGIDRVEEAYLERFLEEPDPLYALVRMKLGYALLGRAGIVDLAHRLRGETRWGPPDLLARLTPGLSPIARQVETNLRTLSLATCARPLLARMLRRHLPVGTTYVNVGHSNLTDRVLSALKSMPGSRVAVLVHDLIPITHPSFQRAGSSEKFKARMQRVARLADIIICNSDATRRSVETQFSKWGPVPPCIVAHLGVTHPSPDSTLLPAELPPPDPFFVALGTIEPRKNHTLLLDIWDHMSRTRPQDKVPTLVIIGARGWNNAGVFTRLDQLDPGGTVREAGSLPDGAAAALLQGATALLFPSHIEGFGLPAVEAAALGTPVVCGPLDIFHEILGDTPVYADTDDIYPWIDAIDRLTERQKMARGQARTGKRVTGWVDHFKIVLTKI